jgi:hypothetical protein
MTHAELYVAELIELLPDSKRLPITAGTPEGFTVVFLLCDSDTKTLSSFS